jgi:ribosomal protein S12 methylthiotransferase
LKYKPYKWRGADYETRFIDLARGLSDLGVWTRLHYVYPYPHVDEVIPLMAEGKILPYLDIPFQHASPKILKAMRRPAAQEKTLERINRWRTIVPDLVIRSTFIVGFPGETEEDFELLLDWLKEARLARVGCFKFEPVDGARANALPDHVAEQVKEERYHRFMTAQREISADILQDFVGREIDVLIDAVDAEGAVGRSYADAPEIDGSVILAGAKGVAIGDMVRTRIIGADAYDLKGEIAP